MTNYNEEQRIKAFNKTLKEKQLTMLSEKYLTARHHYEFQCNVCNTVFTKVAHSVTIQEVPCPSCTKIAKAQRHRMNVQSKFLARFKELGLDEWFDIKTYPDIIKNNAEFIHKDCGEVITTSLGNLSRIPKSGTIGCKYCSGRHTYTEEEIREYFELERPTYTFIRSYMNDKHHLHVEFIHDVCGEKRDLQFNVVLRGRGCRHCAQSGGEETIAYALDKLGVPYEQEKTFEGLHTNTGRLKRVDFYLPTLNMAIEYDGEQHFKAVDSWGGDAYLKKNQLVDGITNDFFRKQGIPLHRIPYTYTGSKLEAIVGNIVEGNDQSSEFRV